MPRGPRAIPTCGTFHFMMRGNNKKYIFRRNCEYRYFKELLFMDKGDRSIFVSKKM